jgi:hypothetical protein
MNGMQRIGMITSVPATILAAFGYKMHSVDPDGAAASSIPLGGFLFAVGIVALLVGLLMFGIGRMMEKPASNQQMIADAVAAALAGQKQQQDPQARKVKSLNYPE